MVDPPGERGNGILEELRFAVRSPDPVLVMGEAVGGEAGNHARADTDSASVFNRKDVVVTTLLETVRPGRGDLHPRQAHGRHVCLELSAIRLHSRHGLRLAQCASAAALMEGMSDASNRNRHQKGAPAP